MASIFTRIIRGEIPCYKVAEDDKFIAFLDVRPLTAGHTLVVPKIEINYIFDMDDHLLAEMTLFAKKVSRAIEQVVKCRRIGLVVIGLEVPHAHIHLIPLNKESDLLFTNPRIPITDEEGTRLSRAIAEKLVL